MNQRDFTYVTNGASRLIAYIRAPSKGATLREFPAGIGGYDIRVRSGESYHTWFKRCVDECFNGNVARCQVENKMAVLARVRWDRRFQLAHADIQILLSSTFLDPYYRTGEGEATYVRLDYEPDKLGNMFSHPLPHVHVSPEGPLRMGLNFTESCNIIMEFLDFIYRNFYYDEWVAWARQSWDREYYKGLAKKASANPMTRIISAFQGGLGEVRGLGKDVIRLKKVLRTRRDELCPVCVNQTDLELINY